LLLLSRLTWRPRQPKNKNGWKHHGGKIGQQLLREFAASGGVPNMDEGVKGKEYAASESRRPGSPRLDC
jgi:hypothetical protein